MVEVYVDGASAGNPGPSGAGVFIKGNKIVEKHMIPLGNVTSHEAEFLALLHALKICLKQGYMVVSCRTDSELVNTSVEKSYVKNKDYARLLNEILSLAEQFDLFFLKWIPNIENKVADELARAAIRKNKR